MDAIDREILSAFGIAGARERTLIELGIPLATHEQVTRLLERGLLRRGQNPETLARTEDGRLALAGPLDLTIYSRPGCHLCEEAKFQIAPLLKEFRTELTEINIDEDPQLRALYDYDVPVILLASRKVAKHRVDLKQFRRQLQDAAHGI